VYIARTKLKELSVVLCAVGLAGAGAIILLHSSRPHTARKILPGRKLAAHRAHPPTLNRKLYNAKLLSLANLSPRPGCSKDVVATSRATRTIPYRTVSASEKARVVTKEAVFHPCAPAPWPVDAPYPDAGAVLPFKRIVAYYGNFYSKRMGVLGEYPPDKMLSMLDSTAKAWAAADPSTPVVPAVDYIAVAAQNVPWKDGKYRFRMPSKQIDKAISMGDRIHGLVFLDVQTGWSTVEAEVPRLVPYLKMPNVELALDPEFALVEGKRPGTRVGTMNAAEINYAARFLAKIVQENHLPPKILVVHRFTERMVTNFHAIKPLPEVQIVMDMDGFGSPVLKISTYKSYIARQPVQFTGFKLFYKNDVKIGGALMTPAQILSLSPQPSFILYQ
jgi:hypothetical protein